MKSKIGKKVLVTTASWFMAPDGRQYKGVYGTLKSIDTAQDTLGFVPSRTNTNWFINVGNMSIAGCQIQYITETEDCNFYSVEDFTVDRTHDSGINGRQAESYTRGSYIYKAD